MGGEKLKQRMCSTAIAGSPPRGRGKDKLNVREDFAPGITPAWAGKSRLCIVPCICFGDHPRVGGEKLWSNGLRWCWVGSPPRGRGKAEHESRKNRFPGITPAWAGKSSRHAKSRTEPKDHPRVGGEKSLGLFYSPDSPGITPAWAGKRLKRSHRSGIFISGPIPFHSVLHRPAGSGGSRAGRDGSPAGQPQSAGPA